MIAIPIDRASTFVAEERDDATADDLKVAEEMTLEKVDETQDADSISMDRSTTLGGGVCYCEVDGERLSISSVFPSIRLLE